jgi:hypothetical protein
MSLSLSLVPGSLLIPSDARNDSGSPSKMKPLDSMEEGAPEGGGIPSSDASLTTAKPWWMFWRGGGGGGKGEEGDKEFEAAAKEAERAAEAIARSQKPPPGDIEDKPWWKFWARGDVGPPSSLASMDGQEGHKASSSGSPGNKGPGPVEAVYIPPDLSIEEIAKELAKIKESESKSRDNEMGEVSCCCPLTNVHARV